MNDLFPHIEAPPEKVSSRSAMSDFISLQNLAIYLRIAGAGGGGFAALCFGIGYLAIKNHDHMIGLPSGIASNTAYIRTGALFFTNSFYYVLTATFFLFVVACVMSLVIQV